jgi:hypothetical protein
LQIEKLLTRLVLGTSLPKFNGDVRFWPNFLAIYRRQIHECQLNQSENMQRLRDALEEPARSCVEMLLLTDDAERVMSKLKQNFGNTTSIMKQLDIRPPSVTENTAPPIKVIMKRLPVQFRGIVDVLAFFDDGSNITLLDSSITVKLVHLYTATGRVI